MTLSVITFLIFFLISGYYVEFEKRDININKIKLYPIVVNIIIIIISSRFKIIC
jgi:hypothetical protein